MKKLSLTLIGFLSFCTILFAKQIDVRIAQTVAQTFLSGTTSLRSTPSLNLVYTEKDQTLLRSGQAENYYYVFNIGNNNGFIIISADDVNVPIIGYSLEGSYDSNNLPPNFKGWMDDVRMGMKEAISKGETSSEKAASEWQNLQSGKAPVQARAASVHPLVKTKWSQGHPTPNVYADEIYNLAIPFREGGKIPYTGCVATAMAQVMKYHNYPASGIKATPAYTTTNSNQFKVPSIDVTKTVYKWGHMLNTYDRNSTSTQIDAVAELMYHCGASVYMNFSINGSGAVTERAANALKSYFNYHQGTTYTNRSSDDTQWKNLLKTELDNKRPMMYRGRTSDNSTGHTFVCDGYDVNELFHFNWGWAGYQDGYYNVNAALSYSYQNAAIIGIKPAVEVPKFKLSLAQSLSSSIHLNSMKIGESSNMMIKIKNTGNKDFTGYLGIGLTDNTGSLKYILNSQTSVKLIQQNKEKTDYISCKIPLDAIPGQYLLKLFYMEEAASVWQVIESGSAPYSMPFTVVGLPNLTYNQGIYAYGLTSKREGESFDTRVSLKNGGNGTFEGYYAVALTNDNNEVKYILNYEQSNTLITIAPNAVYNKVEACQMPNYYPEFGTYNLRILYKAKGENLWKQLNTGATPYSMKFALNGIYKLAFGEGLASNVGILRPGGSFNTRVYVYNRGYAAFEGNLAVALTDISGNVKYILNQAQSTRTLHLNYTAESTYQYDNTETCVIPSNAVSGDYYLRVVYKETGTTKWIPIKGGTSPYEQIFTIATSSSYDMEYGIGLVTGSDINSKKAGETFMVKIGPKNTGMTKFEGYYAPAFTDASGNIKYILNTTMTSNLMTINPGSYFWNFHECAIPANTAPGTYYLRTIYKEKTGSAWKILNKGVSPYYVLFTVTSNTLRNIADAEEEDVKVTLSVYPNPVGDILYVKSGSAAIKNITLTNMSGTVVRKQACEGNSSDIYMRDLPVGVYIVTVETELSVITRRVQKQ